MNISYHSNDRGELALVPAQHLLAIFYALQAIDLQSDHLDEDRKQEMIHGLGNLGELIADTLFSNIDSEGDEK